MSEIAVRLADPADAEAIAQLCAAAWRDTYREIYTPEYIEAVIAEYYTPDRIVTETMAATGWDG